MEKTQCLRQLDHSRSSILNNLQEENERTQQKMKDLEAAHKESMNQFKNKIGAEQKAQVEDLRRQMENDKEEVSPLLPNPLEFVNHL